MKPQNIWRAFGGSAIVMLGTGAWYVFMAGAPQLDPPLVQSAQQMQQEGLSFHLESFMSQAMKATRTYGVILPPGYSQNSTQHYPVIFLLHGGHDDARAYIDKYGMAQVLADLYQSHKLEPSIIITPDGNDQRGSSPLWDPQYFDGPNGRVATLIGSELVQVVKERYRTSESPKFWAMGGISSGGWGAFNIGLRYLNHFNILFSHSGYFTDSSGATNSPNQFIQTLPLAQLKQLRGVYLDAGENDTDFLTSTQQFHETLNRLGVTNKFYAFPGGHGLSGPNIGWNYFHKHLYDSLTYIGAEFQRASSPVS
ncbi:MULTISPECIES: alpha/beta hydrolase-fold protein [unclassified Leptolyngbya]|uniref:alpha/beta hydrolase n=1 Tax=unclassified Leptolyngbya TaxID=2650499 RepID=UPI0016857485|nr:MULTISPECIES: alpha/beta hydrolase-fold protein [unclassified Leptolyngbya]MBD1911837.1 esterase family protein [Leptolyngbya sp. FACHB-8]MBD2158210.1 esterase family protein [Leptolyngbya sp. FACHB-16]